MNTFKFADGRIKLFNYIMLNLGSYICFQHGDSVRVSISGNEVSFCDESWHIIHTVVID